MNTLKNIFSCSFFFIFFASSAVIAQNLQCPDISKTLKEYSIESSSSSYLSAVFTEHCQVDGSRKSKSFGLGIDMIVKSIPVNFRGSYTSSDEAMTNFCKLYSSQSVSTNTSDLYKETISRRSLETIDQCNVLQASGVIISHKITNAESANFYLKGSVTQTFELQGVAISGPVKCEGVIGGTLTAFNASLSIPVKSTISFTCARIGHPSAQNALTSYPESVVTVLTNQGNYSLFWPRDERLSEDMASQVDRRITKIEENLAVTNANVSPFISATQIPVYKCPTGNAISHDAAWMTIGCNGQISSESTCRNHWYAKPSEVRQCAFIGILRVINP